MNDTSPFSLTSGRYWVYVFEGVVLLLANGLIFLSILYHQVLRERKEFVLPAALAFCDAIEGLSAMLAGLGRNWMLANGKAHVLVSRRTCLLLRPWNYFWVFNQHVYDPTLLAISVDRFVAVAFPLFHYGLTKSYALRLLMLAWGPGIVALMYVIYASLGETEPIRPSLCFALHCYSGTYHSVLYTLRILLSTSSVLLYVVVIVLYLRHGSNQMAAQGSSFKEYLKSQRRFTVTLGMSCVFTFLFYVLPVVVPLALSKLYGNVQSELALMIVPYAYIVENINRMLNLLLYSFRHRNIRMGMLSLLVCKQLAQNTNAVQALEMDQRNKQANRANHAQGEHPEQLPNAVPSDAIEEHPEQPKHSTKATGGE